MRYYSTNRNSNDVSFAEAARSGFAPDGGLYIPAQMPLVPDAIFRNMDGMSSAEIAYVVMTSLLGGDLSPREIKDINSECISFPLPVRRLGSSPFFSCELFHGPTGSCKDLGVRYMARLLSRLLPDRQRITLIASISSDYGIAIADAFAGVAPFEVIVTVPKGRLSPEAAGRIFSLGGNIHAVEVRGSVADCLAMTRTALVDRELAGKITLTSANSINIARLLPLVTEFFIAWSGAVAQGADPAAIVFSVPCGNLSNLTAALLAARMGLPIRRIVAAGNANSSIVSFLSTGDYEAALHSPTSAPALDVGLPINLPRVSALLPGLGVPVSGYAVSDSRIASARRRLAEDYSYSTDPHSAVAAAALMDDLQPGEYGIMMATGRPVFAPASPSPHRRHETIPPTYSALKRFIETY